MDRNWLKGPEGDAMHALLCGAGQNLRLTLRKLRLPFAWILCNWLRLRQPHRPLTLSALA